MTAEDWAPYGIGDPDAEGWYPDYRTPPADLRPAVATHASPTDPDAKRIEIDGTIVALLQHWRLVVAELAERGVDLYDPAVRARPWPGVRTLIFSLLDSPTRLRAALTRG